MMNPKGLHVSLHINGRRHMATAAARQVKRMKYNFMVKLKNNTSIMAMEGE
jgi:hypothetical protein